MVVPTIADRFGARTFIRELTYMKIYVPICQHTARREQRVDIIAKRTFLRASSRLSARSSARETACHSESGRGCPAVVVAVIMRLMTMGAGMTLLKLTFVGSCAR